MPSTTAGRGGARTPSRSRPRPGTPPPGRSISATSAWSLEPLDTPGGGLLECNFGVGSRHELTQPDRRDSRSSGRRASLASDLSPLPPHLAAGREARPRGGAGFLERSGGQEGLFRNPEEAVFILGDEPSA